MSLYKTSLYPSQVCFIGDNSINNYRYNDNVGRKFGQKNLSRFFQNPDFLQNLLGKQLSPYSAFLCQFCSSKASTLPKKHTLKGSLSRGSLTFGAPSRSFLTNCFQGNKSSVFVNSYLAYSSNFLE